jgi:5-methylcytosine-specific restriction endonuclease McrA
VAKQHISAFIRRQVIARDGYHCVYCDEDLTNSEIHLDHVIAESKGGATSFDNLQVTCRKCNTMKGAMSEEEFIDKLRTRAQNILWRLGPKK